MSELGADSGPPSNFGKMFLGHSNFSSNIQLKGHFLKKHLVCTSPLTPPHPLFGQSPNSHLKKNILLPLLTVKISNISDAISTKSEDFAITGYGGLADQKNLLRVWWRSEEENPRWGTCVDPSGHIDKDRD